MKQHLQQLWRKFLKDPDIYLIIPFAALFFVLGLINVAPAQIMQSSILAVLAILAFSILKSRQKDEAIETMLQQVAKPLSAKINIYKRQEDAYKFLQEYSKHRHVREAVMLQYSCIFGIGVLRTLLSLGATVTVYIQHEKIPMALGAHEQVDRISHRCKSFHADLATLFNSNQLKVYKYYVPASVSCIKVDFGTEQILCMGWYTYEHIDGSNRRAAYPADTLHVSGHDMATVVEWSGTEEFEALNETFKMLEKNYQANSEEWPLL